MWKLSLSKECTWILDNMNLRLRWYIIVKECLTKAMVKKHMSTTKNSHITWEFSCKFAKRICKKRLFPTIFSKNFNWQVISSWIIISYKIIKFASIFYKICCKICYKIYQKNVHESCKFFFIKKFINIFYEKNFKTKLAWNMDFSSSVIF